MAGPGCFCKVWLWEIASRSIVAEATGDNESTAWANCEEIWALDFEEAAGYFISGHNQVIPAFAEDYEELSA
jgi:hypothetical protein